MDELIKRLKLEEEANKLKGQLSSTPIRESNYRSQPRTRTNTVDKSNEVTVALAAIFGMLVMVALAVPLMVVINAWAIATVWGHWMVYIVEGTGINVNPVITWQIALGLSLVWSQFKNQPKLNDDYKAVKTSGGRVEFVPRTTGDKFGSLLGLMLTPVISVFVSWLTLTLVM